MAVMIRQISSLEKVRRTDCLPTQELFRQTALAGQRVSYQICITAEGQLFADVRVRSELAEHIQIYCVKDAVMDAPVTFDVPLEDYITHEPGLMPDILVPLASSYGRLSIDKAPRNLWIRLDLPKDLASGVYSVAVDVTVSKPGGKIVESCSREMVIDVLPFVMPEQELIYTRWLYVDCIANVHNVPIYSEVHWELIEKYIAAAVDVGINMILVPIHTPPLDTEVGTMRPCVQLVDIEKRGEEYIFSFEKLHRYIAICKKCGVRYYEIAHMFSQWGAKSAANIRVTENGKTEYKFDWHTDADDPEYIHFLRQYIAAISRELEKEGIAEYTFYHISDEPQLKTLENYKTAAEIIHPLIGRSKTCDAISNYEFYEKGLTECPVTAVESIHTFLAYGIDDQWVYYCCQPQSVYPNAFMAMPSYRIRILGVLLYKYNIKGFLHWGFNYYNASRSVYTINPYVTTSGDGAYPSGDPFIVYPGEGCVHPSVRGEVLYDATQDMNLCFAVEKVIGREKVVELIDKTAGFDLRFDDYPRNKEYLLELREMLMQKLSNCLAEGNIN